MTPYFLQLLFFYKTRYWSYSLQRRPVVFILSKGFAILLATLFLVQVAFAFTLEPEDMLPIRQLSFGKLFASGLLLNLGRLFYFPSGYQRDIKRGRYFLYPLSGYALNNLRIVEGSFSMSFLTACNLLVLPLFALSPVYGIFLPAIVLVLNLLTLFIYDLTMLIFERLFLFVLALLLVIPVFVFKTPVSELTHFVQVAIPARPGTIVTATVLLLGLLYYLDTQLLILTSVKNAPHE